MLDAAKAIATKAVGAVTGALGVSNPLEPQEVQDGEKFYKRCHQQQRAYHPVWYKSIAGYIGQMWLDWNTATNWLQESAAPSWRVRLTTNLVMPTVRTLVAKDLEADPTFYGMPSKEDDESRRAAKIATKLSESFYYDENFQLLLQRALTWKRCTGASFLWSLWDGTAGRRWTDTVKGPDGQPVIDPATGLPKEQEYFEGEVVHDFSNSFETVYDMAGPENFAEHKAVMRVKIMDVDEIYDRWGVKVEPEKFASDTIYQQRVMNIIDTGGRQANNQGDSEAMKNKAFVKEFFQLPTRAFPNGRHFMYANGVVIQPSEDLDYYYAGRRALPCVMIPDIIMPGRPQPGAIVEQILSLNIQYNKLNSAAIENLNLLSRPKVVSPVGALEDSTFTNEPGEVVEYNPTPGGGKPEPWTPPEMPQYFFTMRDSLPPMMEDVSNVHEVSKGRLPRRANSGVAIKALQTGDDTPVALSVRTHAAALSRLMSISLGTVQDKYQEKRLLRMVGENHQIDLLSYMGADLKSCDVIRVEIDHSLSRSERQDIADTLFQEQAITAQDYLRILDGADLSTVLDRDAGERQYVDMENLQMAKGIAEPVGPMETHPLHIQGHSQFLNSARGTALPPEIKAIIAQHIAAHQAADAANQAPINQPAPPAAPPAPMEQEAPAAAGVMQ